MERVYPLRSDQGTWTRGSPVGRRSRLVDVDREFRAAEHPQVPHSGLLRRKTPKGRTASEQQAVPPLTSAALRGTPHDAAELDSGNRRSLPGLGSTLFALRSDLPGLHADLPGLRPNLPRSIAPLSGKHVPPPRGHADELPRGRHGRRLEITFPGHSAGVQQDAVAPYITAAHRTAPALSSDAACVSPAAARVSPLDARSASVAIFQPRVAVSRERDCRARISRRSAVGNYFFRAYCGITSGPCLTPLHYSSPRNRPSFGPARWEW